jgi:hypothetical protein
MRVAALAASAWCATACDGGTVNAGEDGDGGELRTYKWQGTVSNSFDKPCGWPVPQAYRGVWEGEFDAYAFPSGSKKLRIEVQGLSEMGLCGTVTFGEGEPPSVPTDPEAPYAPGLPGDPVTYEGSSQSRLVLVEGFSYEFGRGESNLEGEPTISEVPNPLGWSVLDLTSIQPYKAWCNLQTAYPRVTSYAAGDFVDYLCVPGAMGVTSNGTGPADCYVQPFDDPSKHVPVSCTQYTLCANTHYCTCGENGCTVNPGGNIPAILYFQGDMLGGSVDLDLDAGLDARSDFHLTRVKP